MHSARWSRAPLLLLLLSAAGLGSACEASGGRTAESAPGSAVDPASLQTVAIQVEGMVCEGCQGAITDAVGKLPGVASCVASHEKKLATIQYDPATVQPAALVATIAELGYRAALPGEPMPAAPPEAEAASSVTP